jgi:integrase
MKRMFAYARKRHLLSSNPAADFNTSDAGGSEQPRDRTLSMHEIGILFAAIETAETLGRDNELAIKLLLLLGVRKMELLAAQWTEFDLEAKTWRLPVGRSKTNMALNIPLPRLAVTCVGRA